MKYEIGDALFCATFESQKDYITCPDCGGTRTLKVILWDGTEYIINCAGCAAGYEPPRGWIRTYKRTPKVAIVTISGIEIKRDGLTEYRASLSENSCRILNEDELFADKAEAEVRAAELVKELEQKERDDIEKKEKPTRTWSWHVYYHRKQIRDAEKTIACATDKLNAAKRHVKSEK